MVEDTLDTLGIVVTVATVVDTLAPILEHVTEENHGYKPTMGATSVPSGLCQKDREHLPARPTHCRL